MLKFILRCVMSESMSESTRSTGKHTTKNRQQKGKRTNAAVERAGVTSPHARALR